VKKGDPKVIVICSAGWKDHKKPEPAYVTELMVFCQKFNESPITVSVKKKITTTSKHVRRQ